MIKTSYKVYNTDQDFHNRYSNYQNQYVNQPRESDKVFLQKLAEVTRTRKTPFRLLDVGCSNGNLLLHVKNNFPHLELSGIDLNVDIIKRCRKSRSLGGIRFFEGSGLELSKYFKQEFDLVIANAMVQHLSQNEFKIAVEEFAHVLKPAGQFWAFDGFHPFDQEIEIIERSAYGSEQGIPIYYRSYSGVKSILKSAGFESFEFQPFEMPFDLNRAQSDFVTLRTHTVKTEDGTRMSMRGTLFQPWCHLFASKA